MPVQQHPIPQDVSNYKFRLVGDMTLKQFLQLAVGIVLGILIWNSPLPFFFKYPLTIIFVCLGIGMAFVPIEGRPLDQWLIAFIKSIYSPTIYVWEKSSTENLAKPSTSITPTSTAKLPPAKSPSVTMPTPSQSAFNQASVTSPTPSIYVPNQSPPQSPPPSSSMTITQTPPPAATITPAYQPKYRSEISPSSNLPISTKSDLPIPFTPTTPNTLVGMVLTLDNHIVENAIIEIIHNGLTIRATKSNKLGQFLFARPLENGTYHIVTQKNEHSFDTYALTLTGQVVPPLKLQARI